MVEPIWVNGEPSKQRCDTCKSSPINGPTSIVPSNVYVFQHMAEYTLTKSQRLHESHVNAMHHVGPYRVEGALHTPIRTYHPTGERFEGSRHCLSSKPTSGFDGHPQDTGTSRGTPQRLTHGIASVRDRRRSSAYHRPNHSPSKLELRRQSMSCLQLSEVSGFI